MSFAGMSLLQKHVEQMYSTNGKDALRTIAAWIMTRRIDESTDAKLMADLCIDYQRLGANPFQELRTWIQSKCSVLELESMFSRRHLDLFKDLSAYSTSVDMDGLDFAVDRDLVATLGNHAETLLHVSAKVHPRTIHSLWDTWYEFVEQPAISEFFDEFALIHSSDDVCRKLKQSMYNLPESLALLACRAIERRSLALFRQYATLLSRGNFWNSHCILFDVLCAMLVTESHGYDLYLPYAMVESRFSHAMYIWARHDRIEALGRFSTPSILKYFAEFDITPLTVVASDRFLVRLLQMNVCMPPVFSHRLMSRVFDRQSAPVLSAWAKADSETFPDLEHVESYLRNVHCSNAEFLGVFCYLIWSRWMTHWDIDDHPGWWCRHVISCQQRNGIVIPVMCLDETDETDLSELTDLFALAKDMYLLRATSNGDIKDCDADSDDEDILRPCGY